MHIGIDARFLGPAQTGPGRYTQKLVDTLEEIDERNEYSIFLRKDNWDVFEPKNPNFRKVLADYRWYSLDEQLFLPRVIHRVKPDFMHFPHFNVPMFWRGPFVVTIHDLIITHYPSLRATTLGPIAYGIKQFGYRLVIRSAAQRAKKILTVSQFSRQEILSAFRIPEQKVVVTYEACDGPAGKAGKTKPPAPDRIRKPYLLYVGNTYPHKNLEGLLEAFRRLRQEGFDFQLVIVGKEDYFIERLKKLAIHLSLTDQVVFTGFVRDEELPAYYQNALVYVFPSFLEGFGLPALEAMAWGVPVAASRTSSLPEILGDAAEYFNPHDIRDIVTSVERLVKDDALRHTLIRKGLKHVQRYSWKKMAEKTLAVYEEIFLK